MKKIFSIILSLAAFSLAANVQVLAPEGAEFAPDAPNMVQSIVRASVSQTGNTPVDGSAEIQLRTNVMTMGSTFVVVCEQVKDGTVVGSGKQKAGSVDDLDVAIEGAVKSALANVEDDNASAAPAAAPAEDNYASTANRSEPEVVVLVGKVIIRVAVIAVGGHKHNNFGFRAVCRRGVCIVVCAVVVGHICKSRLYGTFNSDI